MTAGKVHLVSPVTVTGATGPLLAESDLDALTIIVTSTAVSGTSTPTVTFTAERSLPGQDAYPPDDSTGWDSDNAVSASGMTTASTKTITLPPSVDGSGRVGTWWHLKWVVTGTNPSFTISVATADG
jgi:hypothetical protein